MEKEQINYYWYEYRLRGFSLGCQPKGFASIDPHVGKFGAIAYKEPLTDKQVDDYDLKPLGVVTV
ncbi:hypothetical protein [Virgibacillus sp. CBA3643]|uniref:defense against restriction DarA-related protein n=1 Tax=Virgibacillus sp. CBA3643 TaxID=2942278 RepID=UPI0035A3881A